MLVTIGIIAAIFIFICLCAFAFMWVLEKIEGRGNERDDNQKDNDSD